MPHISANGCRFSCVILAVANCSCEMNKSWKESSNKKSTRKKKLKFRERRITVKITKTEDDSVEVFLA